MKRSKECLLAALALLLVPCVGFGFARAADESQGFLYGRIITDGGTEYVGFLRWGDEEACWDDLFHSLKEDLPYQESVDWKERKDRPRRRGLVKVLSWMIEWESDKEFWEESASRIFIARFGDIREIRVTGGEDAEVVMKSGESYGVSGYANDVGGTVHVEDGRLGEIDLRWNRIDTIEFLPVPAGAQRGAYRLHGRVETDAGEFSGFIQWDKQECLSTDLLDGETRDGDVSIEMGRIRSIERRGRSSSLVVLKDGRELRLRGTNDVNSENRGIMVEDLRYGRLTIPWGEFEMITFSDPGGSGPGYERYGPLGWLHGKVIDRDDREHRGRLVIDLDEAEAWEMLNGSYREIKFDIPLANVRVIEPRGYDESRITLHGGAEIDLEDGQDVSDKNDGVLIFQNDDDDRDALYIPWDEIERIEFDH